MLQKFHSWLYIHKNKNSNPKRYMHPNIQSSVTTAKLWKQSKHPSTSEWIKKIWYTPPTHTHTMDYYSDIKKTEILPSAATRMD